MRPAGPTSNFTCIGFEPTLAEHHAGPGRCLEHGARQRYATRADNRGRLRGQVLLIGCVGEVGVPAPVVVGEGVVEYPGADLE